MVDAHQASIELGQIPDGNKPGHGLAQLAAYAQCEWLFKNIPCPLEHRLRSLYYGVVRICDGDPAQVSARANILFEFATRVSYSNSIEDGKELTAWWWRDKPKITRTVPAVALFESVFEHATFHGEFWLESLVGRLKHDNKAYQRDIARASLEYAALADVNGKTIPVEMVRIENPESLLFDFWAWQDFEHSKERKGFPLVWIDAGWGCTGFQLRLNRSRQDLRPLNTYGELAGAAQVFECGWDLRPPVDKALEIRLLLKRGLFSEDKFEIADIPFSDASHTVARLSSVDDAIWDSKVDVSAKLPVTASLPEQGYRWAQFTYSGKVDIFATWAGDEIAGIIYSPLRQTRESRMPNDFLSLHVQRQPGLVTVWSRDGLAVAVQDGNAKAAEIASDLKTMLEKSAQLEKGLNSLLKNGVAGNQRKATLKDCVEAQLTLRRDTALPQYRPLRQFVERRHLQEVYDAFRQSEADAEQSKTLFELSETGRRQRETLEGMHKAEKKMRWLELAIFSVYVTEASHLASEVIIAPRWQLLFVCAFTVAGTLLAAQWLFTEEALSKAPQAGTTPKREAAPWALGALLLLLFLGSAILGIFSNRARDNDVQLEQIGATLKQMQQSQGELNKELTKAGGSLEGIRTHMLTQPTPNPPPAVTPNRAKRR